MNKRNPQAGGADKASEAQPGASDARAVLINARLVDPASGRDEPGGILIENGRIADLGGHLRRNAPDGVEVIDCANNVVCPGLIDMQVFVGEPGNEHRETLATASRAAAAGGVTTIVCLPEATREIDDLALVDYIQRRARDTAIVNVLPMAALTKGLAGEEMSELGLLKEAGAVAFSNGSRSVGNARVMRRCLAYAKDFDALVVHQTEDIELAASGVMNEGEVATRLGLPGVPDIAETIVLARDVRLVELTMARYHAAAVTCADSLDVVKRARAKGLPVTCGTTVNHLTLNENDIGSYRTFLKMRPPLRREEDRAAMVQGLVSGEIDIVVSAHNPQDEDGKRRPFAEAADGAIGVETLLPAALRLYHAGEIGLLPLLRTMTIAPARLLRLDSGRLAKGAPADICVVDIDKPWVLDRELLHSRSKNTPFDEARMQGRIMRTLVAGKTVYTYADDR